MLDIAFLIPRVIIGLLFMGHGLQKLLGWFGGGGIGGTAGFFEKLGIYPAGPWAVIAGLGELLGGLALALGFATPIAAALLSVVMLTAIAFVHLPNGLWVARGGVEYPLVVIAVSAFFGLAGAGQYALDAYWHLSWPTPQTYVIGLILAVIIAAALRLIALWRTGSQRAPAHGTA